MPSRLLRDALLLSRKWNNLDWQTQSFYLRLIPLADDFGRYHGDPLILQKHAFPLRVDVTEERVAEMCAALVKAGMAIFYEHDEKPYLQLTQWKDKPRALKSRFPDATGCKRLCAVA